MQKLLLPSLPISGEYAGVFFLTKKIKIDQERIDITNVYKKTAHVNDKLLENFEFQKWSNENSYEQKYYYNVEKNPEDITGGY